jgi:cold shock CspA family protein
MGRTVSGTVKWYNPEKAYGFITVEGGEDIFVHRNALVDGREWLVDGQGVSLVVRPGLKGLEAAEVRVTQDVAEIPAGRAAAFQRARYGDSGGARDGEHGAGGGYGGGHGGAPRRPAREPYLGPVPSGPVTAIVQRLDPNGRFLFVRLEREELDVFVHGALVDRLPRPVRAGDRVEVQVEQSERGPRARTLAPA